MDTFSRLEFPMYRDSYPLKMLTPFNKTETSNFPQALYSMSPLPRFLPMVEHAPSAGILLFS